MSDLKAMMRAFGVGFAAGALVLAVQSTAARESGEIFTAGISAAANP